MMDYRKSTLADLRAIVEGLKHLPDDTPLGVLFDSSFGRADGIEFNCIVNRENDPTYSVGTVLLDISDFQ